VYLSRDIIYHLFLAQYAPRKTYYFIDTAITYNNTKKAYSDNNKNPQAFCLRILLFKQFIMSFS